MNQLQGLTPGSDFLLRSTSDLMLGQVSRDAGILRLVLPFLYFSRNTGLPLGENDGALWAGKGSNLRAIAGVEAVVGAIRVVLLPELSVSQNEGFTYTPQFVPPLPATRSPYSSPWNVFPYSIDAPVRFGAGKLARLSPGQSSLTIVLPRLEAGFATENQWWGPGLRTAIIMSDNAEGYPRFFLRNAEPWQTRIGNFGMVWTWGGLAESGWFDFEPTNDVRSISSLAGTWSPAFEPDLTLGAGRSVYAPASGWAQAFSRPFDVFASTGRPNAVPASDSAIRPGRDQLFSLFGRWVFPANGFETYAEWARAEMPKSLRDFLLAPNHSQGYTFGLQWVRALGAGRVRIQAEHSYLEQSSTFRNRQQGSFYTSRAVVQGYTNRGQVIGAGMGQGSSGEWFSTDYINRGWQLGAFASRTRFNNDASYQLPGTPPQEFCPHDVTVSPGARASARTRMGRVSVKYMKDYRLDAFFQDRRSCFGFGPSVDVRGGTLTVGLTLGP